MKFCSVIALSLFVIECSGVFATEAPCLFCRKIYNFETIHFIMAQGQPIRKQS